MSDKIKYALAGGAAGLANGLFGAGGGLLLVPLLAGWIKLPAKEAFASSVFIILPMCVVSAGVYFMTGSIDFTAALPYLAGGLAGGILSGRLFKNMKATWLKWIFGILMLYGGVRAVFLL